MDGLALSAKRVLTATAACVAAAVCAAHSENASYQPPRAIGNVSNAIDNCYALHSRRGVVAGEVEVTVMVDAQGRVTGASSPAGTEERLAAAAQCVAVTLRYEPATLDGEPVAGKASLDVGFPSPPTLRQEARRV